MIFLVNIMKNKFFLLGLFVCMVIHIIDILITHYTPAWIPGNGYILSHYLLSYDLSFMTRSLIGTIYQHVTSHLPSQVFFLLFLLFQVLLFFAITWYFYRCIKKNDFSESSILLFCSYLLIPMTFLTFYDYGRFDVILLFLAFFSLLLIRYIKIAACLLIPALMCIGILTHEAFLFYYIPFLIAWSIFYWDHNVKKTYFLPFCIILGMVMSLYLLFLMRKDIPDGGEIAAYIAERNHFGHIPEHEVTIGAYAGENEETKTYFKHFISMFDSGVIINFLTGILVFSACCVLPGYILYSLHQHVQSRKEKYKIILLALSCLSPLTLCIIALDFGRWFAVSLWCIYMCCFSLFDLYRDWKVPISNKLLYYQIILLAVLHISEPCELNFNRFWCFLSDKINKVLIFLVS